MMLLTSRLLGGSENICRVVGLSHKNEVIETRLRSKEKVKRGGQKQGLCLTQGNISLAKNEQLNEKRWL